jgi:hypothetical protein
MNNEKRTLDCYFTLSTKKDDIIENLIVQSFDANISPISGANDEVAKPASIDSIQNIDIKGCFRYSGTPFNNRRIIFR